MTISDGQARRIAGEWHGGMASGLYSFVSTGTITDRAIREVDAEIAHITGNTDLDYATPSYRATARAELRALQAYLEARGERLAQNDWHRHWSDAPVLPGA